MDQKPPNQPGADGGVRLGLICGFGAFGYQMALHALAEIIGVGN